MAKPRYRESAAQVVELSSRCEATILEGRVTLRRGNEVFDLVLREAQVLAAVVGVGDGPPLAIVNAIVKVSQEQAA